MAKRFFSSPNVTASILSITSETVYTLSVCLNMINSKTFQNPLKFEKFARQSFRLMSCDLFGYGNMSANMHTLLVHGSLYIKYAQDDLGVAPGDLSENREFSIKHVKKLIHLHILLVELV